jgi:anti-anti-sigma regulatory factor
MPVNTVWLKVDGECVAKALQEAAETLDTAGGEVVLDFSTVQRVNSGELQALETLAGKANGKAVKVVLGGVNPTVYKTLKLMKLAPRFSFLS